MNGLYLTADTIGTETGGGQVTRHEFMALSEFVDQVAAVHPDPHPQGADDPFYLDRSVLAKLRVRESEIRSGPTLVHVYAGCFTESLAYLRSLGCRVTYTVAAHSVPASRRAHEEQGSPFPFRHLTDPELFRKYIGGYVDHTDVVICPSEYSCRTVREQGVTGAVVIIPHGYAPSAIPRRTSPPAEFTVGYLGAYGPDKGVPVLIRAWAEYKRSGRPGRLLLGGRDSTHPAVAEWCHRHGAPSVYGLGWLDDPAELYDACHYYVQPSLTEGFGIEVLEAMGRGVIPIVSTGAGAADVSPRQWHVTPGDSHELARILQLSHDLLDSPRQIDRAGMAAGTERDYNWPAIRARYISLWKETARWPVT